MPVVGINLHKSQKHRTLSDIFLLELSQRKGGSLPGMHLCDGETFAMDRLDWDGHKQTGTIGSQEECVVQLDCALQTRARDDRADTLDSLINQSINQLTSTQYVSSI